MLSKLRSAVYGAVGGQEDALPTGLRPLTDPRPPKFAYSRPAFLRLASEDEVQVAGDRSIRPIMVPRDINCMPWMSGYAEAVNAGKSKRNEDNAHIHVGTLHGPGEGAGDAAGRSLQYYYFGVFDGHAGHGASTAAASQLHHIVHEKLADIVDHLLPTSGPAGAPGPAVRPHFLWVPAEELSVDKLVTGALEAAFNDMDALIAEDRRKYEMRGGCTALVALFLLGRLYVANAGDSRAVVCRRGRSLVASHDFTPETERQRVRQLASRQPALCGNEFTHLEFCRRLTRRDLGKRVLYRDAHMTGWAYKTVTELDVKFPVVCGEGKRSRVCATIGVTRGFGDHGLRAQNTNVFVKPFLLSQPEVLIINLEEEAVTEADVLVMATDGLWDVTSNERMAELVERALSHFPAEDAAMRRYRCISAAQELVMAARGKLKENRQWRRSDGSPSTVDDISVFVIPLLAYREEHLLWKAENEAPAAAPVSNGLPSVPPAGSDCTPTANGALDIGQWGGSVSQTAVPNGGLGDGIGIGTDAGPAALDAGDGGPQERVRSDQAGTSHATVVGSSPGGPPHQAGSAASTAVGGTAESETTETSSATAEPAPSDSRAMVSTVSPPVPAPSSSLVPAPSSSVVPAPSTPLVPARCSSVVPAPCSPVVPVPISPVVPVPSSPVVPAPSSPVVAVPSSPVVHVPCSPVVPVPISPVVPVIPISSVVPAPSSPVVAVPSSPVVPVPCSPVVPVPISPVVPVPISPVVVGPSNPVAPAPSSPTVPAPSSTVAPVSCSPAVSVPASTAAPSSPVSDPTAAPSSPVPEPIAAAPLIVGQTVPPTLVQSVPRSSVQLLPPAPAPAPGPDPPPALHPPPR